MAAAEQRQWIPLQKQLVPKTKGDSTAGQYQRNARRRHREAIEYALRKGHLKLLDSELILASQLESEGAGAALELRDVLRISLGGSHVQALDDIAVLSCARLRLCSLESCYLSDISAFYGCVNLLRLDISNNQIERLPRPEFWSSLSSLRVLYLHGNAISRQESLSHLSGCSRLHILTLHDTPISLTRAYRHHVVNCVMSLRALDHHVISDEEIIENLQVSSRFKSLTPNFRLQLYHSSPKGTTFKEELRAVYSLLLAVDRVLARYSPVMVIQRWVRGWLVRKATAKYPNSRLRYFVKKPRIDGGIVHSRAPAKAVHILPEPLVLPSPTSSHSSPRHKSKSKGAPSNRVTRSTPLPPPPPTTPVIASPRRVHRAAPKQALPLPLETHVLGMDANSSKLKYSMHINLHQLHQNVLEAEGSEGEPEFRSAFQHRSPSKPVAVVRPTKQPKQSPPKKAKGKKSDPKPQTPVEGIASIKLLAETTITTSVPLEQTGTAEPETKPETATEQQSPPDDGEIKVTGQTVHAVPHDRVAAMAESNKDSWRMVRDAEKEIKETVAKTRRPLPRPEIARNPNVLTKEELTFARTYTSMTLSAARALERAHESRKKMERFIQRAELVLKMKQERVERQGKIEGFHRELKSSNISWKAAEDSRLDRLCEQHNTKRDREHMRRTQQHDTTVTNHHKLAEDRNFACEFNQQNTLVGMTLSLEDQRQLKDTKLQEVQARVQRAREVSQEHQEMVRRYMELRRSKLLQEGASAKKDLDAKMLEAASHQLMEARRKVAREVARKQAARATITLAKDNLRSVDHTLPSHPHPTVRMDLPGTEGGRVEGDSRDWIADRLQSHPTPASMRRFSREAHRTWQRGAHVMLERQAALVGAKGHTHFPLLPQTEESPLMYEMMRPGSVWSMLNTPGETNSTTSTPTAGTHRQLIVR